MTLPSLAARLKSRKLLIPLSIAILVTLLVLSFASREAVTIATVDAQQGPFSVSIKTSGEIRAANSTTLSVPRARSSQLQIVYLVPEGTTIQPGDVVVKFGTTEVDKTIADKGQELTLLESDAKKTKADHQSRMADLKDNLRNAELAYEQAKLQIEKMKFEAEVTRKDGEINLERSRLAFEQAKRRIKSQVEVDKSEDLKNQMKISQTRSDLERARKDRDDLTLKAPMKGLVVYEINWNTGRKVAIGDQPWPGMNCVSLPDLSKMQAVTNVNEVDVSKVKKSQQCIVRLDAFPDKPFPAKVASVGTIGQQRDRNSGMKTFEVILDIDGTDPILKPGMTTNNEIVMETIPRAVFIPLESVFEKDGKAIVYKMVGSSPTPTEIEVGPKNSNSIVVKRGLNPGDKVTLRDPTIDTKKSASEQRTKEAAF
jgi:HlyD family secretion protein